MRMHLKITLLTGLIIVTGSMQTGAQTKNNRDNLKTSRIPVVENRSTGDTAEKVSLNPQPIPPEVNSTDRQLDKKKVTRQPSAPHVKRSVVTPGAKTSLNPQPIPPKERKSTLKPGAKTSLNPQPIPPKERKSTIKIGAKTSLNPQPIPPNGKKT